MRIEDRRVNEDLILVMRGILPRRRSIAHGIRVVRLCCRFILIESVIRFFHRIQYEVSTYTCMRARASEHAHTRTCVQAFVRGTGSCVFSPDWN